MKILFPVILLLFSVSVHSQSVCSEEQIQKAKLFAQTTTSTTLKFQIERGNFGDCIHHQWMNKMRNTDIKTTVAVVVFSWQDGFKKLQVEEMNFSKNYDFSYIKDKKLLKLIETSGLKEDLKDAFTSRAESVLSNIIPNAKKSLNKKDSDVTKGKIYLHLFDDEILPLQVTTSDIEIY